MALRLLILISFYVTLLQAAEPVFTQTASDTGERHADVLLSDGTLYAGATIRVRDELELSIFVTEKKKRVAVPFKEIARIRQVMVEEGLEKQWRWKEGGANRKFYTGKAYPWRKLEVEITKTDGDIIKGKLSSGVPIKATWSEAVEDKKTGERKKVVKKRKLLLTPRQKGELEETLESLIFVKDITFNKPAKPENKTEKPDAGKKKTEVPLNAKS